VIAIRQAGPPDVELVAPLFDAYRQFYNRPSDLVLSRHFMFERLHQGDSVIFLAEDGTSAVGFVQLYPLFSSTSAAPGRLWLLNDLFVVPDERGRGIGRLLLNRARQLAEETKACGLELATAQTNTGAQALYESLGYRRDEFLHYELHL
jgi:ribosomal protein S18 acetylase RimI-like enzyme